ncbi:SagB/ThcOx family dehydrogenase [Fluviispira vulneris]|uniref:SagB/ThcOx family dehydrogenase n=1 Tax=Fluviispira vulneris TaxID=2763012 RepID=UPI0016477F83|nr:SagB/ThcOx family dehydrogenase [Fluviispira vulneris]
MQYRISDNIFFVFNNHNLILWDYKYHQQYELEKEYLEYLLTVNKMNYIEIKEFNQIEADLIENKILVPVQKECQSEWKLGTIAKIFHIGTSSIPKKYSTFSKEEFSDNYISYCNTINDKLDVYFEYERESEYRFQLPEPKLNLLDHSKLVDSLLDRKTVREFIDETLSLDKLSKLLYLSFGYIHCDNEALDGITIKGKRKSCPSGGNLHPTQAYIMINNVENIEPGIYHYNAAKHSLDFINKNMSDSELSCMIDGQYFSKNSSINVFLTTRFELSAWKYPVSRTYRVSLIDLGHLSQTFNLLCIGLGINCWITGAFNDEKIHNLLKINPNNESALFFLAAGKSTGNSIPQEFISSINKLSIDENTR